MKGPVGTAVPTGPPWRSTTVLALVVGVVLATPWWATLARPQDAWHIAAVEIVPVAGTGAPVMAFVDASCEACADPLLQLRVCGPEATGPASCDVAARRRPADDGVTRMSYSRSLEPGRYRVEVLFLDRAALGGHRSLWRHGAWVDVR